MCNADIRLEIKESGLYHWQIAETMKISESTFCRILRRELPPEKKEGVRAAIRQLQGEVNAG